MKKEINKNNEKKNDNKKRKTLLFLIIGSLTISTIGSIAGTIFYNNKYQKEQSTNEKISQEKIELVNTISSYESKIREFSFKINELDVEIKEKEKSIVYLETNNQLLNGEKEKLETQLTELKEQKENLEKENAKLQDKVEDLKDTLNYNYTNQKFDVFYIKDDTIVHTEQVTKGNDVSYIPSFTSTIPSAEWAWRDDGKNVQSCKVIFGDDCYKLTFTSMLDGADPAFALSASTAYVPCGQDITITPNKVLYGTKTLCEATKLSSFNPTKWDIDGTIYSDPSSTYTVTGPVTITAAYSCVFGSALLTLANGSKVKADDLKLGDKILTYNFFNGAIEPREVECIVPSPCNVEDAMEVTLENGSSVIIIDCEDVFDVDERKYYRITQATKDDIIGRNIMINEKGAISSSKVVSIENISVRGNCYTIYTNGSINYIANDIVLLPNLWYTNDVYTIGADFKIDYEIYNKDIELYGQFDYEVFKDVLDYELFVSWNFKNTTFLIGKGIATLEEVILSAITLQEEVDYCRSYYG